MSAVEPHQRYPLSAAIKEETSALHREAERTGIVRDILRGTATRWSYTLYLRNLLAAYETLEAEIERQSSRQPSLLALNRGVFRAEAIRGDLAVIGGSDWQARFALFPAGRRYVERVATIADAEPIALLAHAYVRYLGDLSGGQIMKRLISRTLKLEPQCLAFYDFPLIDNPELFKQKFRDQLDRIGNDERYYALLLAEAREAFLLNIALSSAIAEPFAQHTNAAYAPRPL